MTSSARVLAGVGMLGLLLCGTAAARSGDVNVIYGEKALDEDRFDESGVDKQPQIGVAVTLDFDWPVALAIDLLSSSEDETQSVASELGPLTVDTDVETLELNVGVRKYWGTRDRVYVGGGLAYVQLDVKQTESGTLGPGSEFTDTILDDDGNGIGLWLNVGYVHRFGDHFNVGLDVRYSDAEADLTPEGSGASELTLDSGGLHYGVQLGFHW